MTLEKELNDNSWKMIDVIDASKDIPIRNKDWGFELDPVADRVRQYPPIKSTNPTHVTSLHL